MGEFNIRIPVLENFATQYGDILSKNSRTLTQAERDVAESMYQQSINYDVVRIVTADIANAPTTLGNQIRISPNYILDNSTLIHELMHVWQYQNKGNGYISNSVVHQVAGMISGGDRNEAYKYTIIPGQSITKYNAEQQAMIVEEYYRIMEYRNNKEYIRLIAEVRKARPTLTNMDRYQESLYGTQNPNFHTPPLLDRRDRSGGTVPIFRLEW